MENISEIEVIKINLKYNHTKWSPKISLEFRANFFQKAEKEAEELGFSFLGDKDIKIIGDYIYVYPIFKDEDDEPVNGGMVKFIALQH